MWLPADKFYLVHKREKNVKIVNIIRARIVANHFVHWFLSFIYICHVDGPWTIFRFLIWPFEILIGELCYIAYAEKMMIIGYILKIEESSYFELAGVLLVKMLTFLKRKT